MRLDSHHHFWRYDAAEYGWIADHMAVLQRDYLPADLAAELAPAGIAGTVAVQARQSLTETDWLLDLAEEQPFIRGVIGWVPLAEPSLPEVLDRLADRPRLRGVRHVLQDDHSCQLMAAEPFHHGIAELTRRGLAYDLLIMARHLPLAIELVDRHPHQVFILDHIAKPPIAAGELTWWAAHLAELARRENVACKLSGMVTEADWTTWTAADLAPYAEQVLAVFGPDRVMFGSDWPVCRLAAEYLTWVEVVTDWTASLSSAEQARVWGGTAAAWYGLEGAT